MGFIELIENMKTARAVGQEVMDVSRGVRREFNAVGEDATRVVKSLGALTKELANAPQSPVLLGPSGLPVSTTAPTVPGASIISGGRGGGGGGGLTDLRPPPEPPRSPGGFAQHRIPPLLQGLVTPREPPAPRAVQQPAPQTISAGPGGGGGGAFQSADAFGNAVSKAMNQSGPSQGEVGITNAVNNLGDRLERVITKTNNDQGALFRSTGGLR